MHKNSLAFDIDLYDENGKWLNRTKDHEEFGEIWEHWGGSWGGRFGDGNHYSISHNGMK